MPIAHSPMPYAVRVPHLSEKGYNYPCFRELLEFLTADTPWCTRLFLCWAINTRCANSQGGILGCSIGINLDYSWNVASTSLSRCRLQKVDRVKLNSAS